MSEGLGLPVSALLSLSNLSQSSATLNQTIKWNGTNWVASASDVRVAGTNFSATSPILTSSLTGTNNTAFGIDVLKTASTGTDNTAYGYKTLEDLTTGTLNVAVGSLVARGAATITTGSGNTLVGAGSGVDANSRSNCIVLGRGAVTLAGIAAAHLSIASAGFPIATSATVGAAGGAAALPATPLTYLHLAVNGTIYKIPMYNP
jgi:hypothetical protein